MFFAIGIGVESASGAHFTKGWVGVCRAAGPRKALELARSRYKLASGERLFVREATHEERQKLTGGKE